MTETNSTGWRYSTQRREPCYVVEQQDLWGDMTGRAWFPSTDAVATVDSQQLAPLEAMSELIGSDYLSYLAASGRVIEALNSDVPLSPIDSSVIPLPHQVRAVRQALDSPRVRYLLADEVGLGKTIEAGLIMRELKLRGLVDRTIVLAPRGLVFQWVAEMSTHFGEQFTLVNPGDFDLQSPLVSEHNIWREYNQAVCSMDSVKPIESRQGWSRQRVRQYNQARFHDLVAAGWDLIIVDEAHRLGGSTDQVARYKLGRALSEASPHLLLLSATPHRGKTDAFRRLLSIIDEPAFPDERSISKERVATYVVRTEKRQAIDRQGDALFQPRHTKLVPIRWDTEHSRQQRLYEAVTEYARDGYNTAMKQKRTYIGFLMILMQRMVSSSTRAIARMLERRLEKLDSPEEQLSGIAVDPDTDWRELDAEEQFELLLAANLGALESERQEVERLLQAAQAVDAAGTDVKADALLDWIYRLQRQEGDPNLKLLVFTEFVPTQQMLEDFLTRRGFSVACLNGSLDLDERRAAQKQFKDDARILISTSAGGEGINLQFCHTVVNYDMPWNPMKLEQRIGRVDRIGQTSPVNAFNFVLEGTVEHRVQEVLEQKLVVILQDFGVDKTADVLDTAQAGRILESAYRDAIAEPDRLEANIAEAIADLRAQAGEAEEHRSILPTGDAPDPDDVRDVLSHPLPYWVERMTAGYVQAHGGLADRHDGAWDLAWPDETEMHGIVFEREDDALTTEENRLTLEHPQVRRILAQLPRFVPGQPIPRLCLQDMSARVEGLWSLWRLRLTTAEWAEERVLPMFIHADGRALQHTARQVWDLMVSDPPAPDGFIIGDQTRQIFDDLRSDAQDYTRNTYQSMLEAHRQRMIAEREKQERLLEARKEAISRIGLPQVRQHRMQQLEHEKAEWQQELDAKSDTARELAPLAIIAIEGGRQDA